MRHFIIASLLLLSFLITECPCLADLPPLIPRAVLFGDPERAAVRISPDGKMLAYQAPASDKQKTMNIWVKKIEGGTAELITHAKKGQLDGPEWQFDGEHILYSQDTDGDENYHVYQTNLKTKTTRDMTPFHGVRASILEMESKEPNTLLVTMNVRDTKFFDVHRINLINGAVELDTKNPGDVNRWIPDHNLKVRAALAVSKSSANELRVRDNNSTEWRTIFTAGPDETEIGAITFTPDNNSILIETSVGANTSRLLQIDVASGKSTVIASDPQYDVGSLMMDPRTHKLEAVCFKRQRSDWQVIDKGIEADFEAIKKISSADFAITSQSLDDKLWTVSFAGDEQPNAYYLFDRNSGKATYLFDARPDLSKYKLAKMQPIDFTARDGMKIYGYLTLPVGLEPKNLPLIIDVHGGPWGRNTWGFNGAGQWFANRGYAVINVNFRGSTGYGKDYVNAGDREWAGKMHTDLLDAKDWAVKQGYADPKRVCIVGHSYGGYAALVGATFTPDEFKCAVSSAGPTNIATLLASIPPYWEAGKALFAKRVGDVVKDKEFLESRSPLSKAQDIKIPVLLVQGANDVRVKRAEGDQLAAAMRKNGKPVEYMVFPDEGHGFSKPENYIKFRAREESFLAKYMGGRLEPVNQSELSEDLLH